MSNKALKYIVIGWVLVMLAQSLEKVAVEFIRSTKEETVPGMFMMPVPFGGEQSASPYGGRNFAESQYGW